MTNWTATAKCSLSIDLTKGFVSATESISPQSLKVTCTSTGTVTFKMTKHYPVSPPDGVAWGLHATASATPTLTVTVDTYDASDVHTNSANASQTLDSTDWLPIAGATDTSSALGGGETTYAVMSCSVPMTSGDILWVDLVGMFASVGQVLIDWTNPAYGVDAAGGDAFVDLTGRVQFAENNITIDRGRQDDVNDATGGTAGFTLDNNDGWFTAQCSASPWADKITLGKRCQINLTDELGNWHTRFDGAVEQIDYSVDITGNTNQAAFTCSDILGYMSRSLSLSAWTTEIQLADGALTLWPMDDQGTYMTDQSGNNGPLLFPRYYGGGTLNTLTPQSLTGGVETQADTRPGTVGPYSTAVSGPAFSLTNRAPANDSTSYNLYAGVWGWGLYSSLPYAVAPNATGEDWTIEVWWMMDPTLNPTYKNNKTGPFTIMAIGESRTSWNIDVGLFTSASGDLKLKLNDYAQPPAFIVNSGNAGSASAIQTINGSTYHDQEGQPHQLVLKFVGASGGGTLTLYVDGSSVGSVTLGQHRYMDTIFFGSAFGGYGSWFGGLSNGAIYDYALSDTQIAGHYKYGTVGPYQQGCYSVMEDVTSIANIPSYWNGITGGTSALSKLDYFDLSGSNALSAMQSIEAIEDGLLFIDATGKIQFHTRSWRQGYGAPDITIPAACYSPDLGYSLNDQYLVTENTIGGTISVGASTFKNEANAALYGDYPLGSPDSPNSLSLLSYSEGPAVAGIQGLSIQLDPEATDYAQWSVNAKGDQYMRPGTVQMDLLAPDSAQPTISDVYAIDIDNVIELTGMPSSMPDSGIDFFIEGIHEEVGQQARTIQFYSTPATIQRAWKPGDATYGVLGKTTRIGRSSFDTHTVDAGGKQNTYDPGPPFWPPTFSTSMNDPSADGHDFVGGLDIRGILYNTQVAMTPPLCVVGQAASNQTYVTGSALFGQIQWDYVYVDTLNAMGAIPGWPNWYVCMYTGWYDIDWTVIWARSTDGGSTSRRSELIIASQAAAALLNGTGDPTTVTQNHRRKSHVGSNSISKNDITQGNTRAYLELGDMMTLACWQDAGASRNTGTDYNGSMMSLVWTGLSTTADH